MQSVTVEGYLAADPSVLSSQGSGRKRASFRLVETTRFRARDGQIGGRTTGFNCVCFSEATAENYVAPFARKGARVIVVGHVENDTWTGRDGVPHYDLRLVVEQIRLKSRRQDGAPSQEESNALDAPAAELDEEPEF